MEIDVIQTTTEQHAARSHGIVDVSEVSAGAVTEFAAEKDVYLERRGNRTYLVPA